LYVFCSFFAIARLQFLAGGKPAHAPHSARVGFVPNLLL
jgi:hypothetical protein